MSRILEKDGYVRVADIYDQMMRESITTRKDLPVPWHRQPYEKPSIVLRPLTQGPGTPAKEADDPEEEAT